MNIFILVFLLIICFCVLSTGIIVDKYVTHSSVLATTKVNKETKFYFVILFLHREYRKEVHEYTYNKYSYHNFYFSFTELFYDLWK